MGLGMAFVIWLDLDEHVKVRKINKDEAGWLNNILRDYGNDRDRDEMDW
jgi:hypothetical protein